MSENVEIDVVEELGIQPIKRPDEIEKDVTSLSQKKKVSNILSSPYFKEELEQAVTDVLCSNQAGSQSIAREIANFFSPFCSSGLQGMGCVSPINDLTGSDAFASYTKTERLSRCKLATLYRIVDLFGWNQNINNYISLRLNKEQEHFLINPYGLLYHEVSAAKLLKVNMQGEILDQGSTTLSLNTSSFSFHSAVHAARPDIQCVATVQNKDILAISCMACGLLPLCDEALQIGPVSVHPPRSSFVDAKERKAIQKSLGPTNKVMIIRNQGLVVCGTSIEETFSNLRNAITACSAQVTALSCMRVEKLTQLSRDDVILSDDHVTSSEAKSNADAMQFEAVVRTLDNMGYRSGYIYRNPNIVKSKYKVNAEVAEPATTSSRPFSCEDLQNVRGGLRRADNTSRWINSPNLYMKVEDDRSSVTSSSFNGEQSPKPRTKWLRSSSPTSTGSASMRTNPNQFVPTGTDPREVAVLRKSIRGQANKHRNPPGPQSQILHSVAPKTATTHISSASKGIIERGVEVTVVAPTGPPNPFAQVTKEELEDYRNQLLSSTSDSKKDSTEDLNDRVVDDSAPVEDESSTTECKEVKVEEVEDEKLKVDDIALTNGAASDDKLQNGDHVTEEVVSESVTTSRSITTRVSFEAAVASEKLIGCDEVVSTSASSREKITEDLAPKSNKKKKKRPLSFLKKKKQK